MNRKCGSFPTVAAALRLLLSQAGQAYATGQPVFNRGSTTPTLTDTLTQSHTVPSATPTFTETAAETASLPSVTRSDSGSLSFSLGSVSSTSSLTAETTASPTPTSTATGTAAPPPAPGIPLWVFAASAAAVLLLLLCCVWLVYVRYCRLVGAKLRPEHPWDTSGQPEWEESDDEPLQLPSTCPSGTEMPSVSRRAPSGIIGEGSIPLLPLRSEISQEPSSPLGRRPLPTSSLRADPPGSLGGSEAWPGLKSSQRADLSPRGFPLRPPVKGQRANPLIVAPAL